MIRHVPRPQLASVAIILVTLSGCGGAARATSSVSTRASRSPMRTPVGTETLAQRCPSRAERVEASTDPTTADVLVPAHPTGALICRYWGINDSTHRQATLAGAFSIQRKTVLDRLAARLNSLPRFPRHSISCPTF